MCVPLGLVGQQFPVSTWTLHSQLSDTEQAGVKPLAGDGSPLSPCSSEAAESANDTALCPHCQHSQGEFNPVI